MQTWAPGLRRPSGRPRLVTTPRVQGEGSRDSRSFRAWPRGTLAAAVFPLPELTTWTLPSAQEAGGCSLEPKRGGPSSSGVRS